MLEIKIIFGVFIVFYVLLVLYFIQRMKRKKEEQEQKDQGFVEFIVKTVGNGSLTRSEDVCDSFLGYFNQIDAKAIDFERLVLLLRRAKLKALQNELGRLDASIITRFNGLIKEAEDELLKQQVSLPFAGVPLPERSLLHDVLELTDATKRGILQDKLSELGSAIRIRQETIDRLGEEKGQALSWTKWGVAGTIIFSLISIGLAIWSLRGASPSN